ncbi:MAG: hypothetical protein AAF569_07015 [Pseudomonadota bacterium]
MSDNPQDIKTRMQELTSFVVQANDTINAGQMVDLQGLDDEVASLCDRTLALPPQQAADIQPLMAEMISKLEELGRSLETFQQNLRDQDSEQ